MEFVETVNMNANDVLSGRGNSVNQHSGNIKFRQIVASKGERYWSSTRDERQTCIKEVIEQITSNNGRFLSKVDDNGLRQMMCTKKIKQKTSQAFRDIPNKEDAIDDKISSNQCDICISLGCNQFEEQQRNKNTADDQICSLQESTESNSKFGRERLKGTDSRNDCHAQKRKGIKYEEQPPGSIIASGIKNQKDVFNQPWSTSISPSQSIHPSYFKEHHEVVYENQDLFNMKMNHLVFSNNKVQDKGNERCLSSSTKHTDSHNGGLVQECREKTRSIAPNLCLDESDQNHPFDMSLSSLDYRIDFSDNQEATQSKQNRFTAAWKGRISQRSSLLNGVEYDEPGGPQSMHGQRMGMNNNIASNQPAQHYPYIAHNDVNEMSFQSEKEDNSVMSNDSVSGFSFDDNLTDTDMRGMIAKFTSMSSRDLIGPIDKL